MYSRYLFSKCEYGERTCMLLNPFGDGFCKLGALSFVAFELLNTSLHILDFAFDLEGKLIEALRDLAVLLLEVTTHGVGLELQSLELLPAPSGRW